MANIPSPVGGRPTSVVGFRVFGAGQIHAMPTRFFVRKSEIVLWIIGNKTTEEIDVSLEGFVVGGESVDPLDWIADPVVHVEVNQIGFIAGVLKDNYSRRGWFGADRVNYSIRVRATSGAFDVVHDPDGDIKP